MNPSLPHSEVSDVQDHGVLSKFKPNPWKYSWIITSGILLVLLGIIALATPVQTSVGMSWLLGLILLATGISQVIHCLQSIKEQGRVTGILLAILSIFAGIICLRNPFSGMVAITLVLSFYFVLSGTTKGFLASEMRPHQGRGWIGLSAFISIVLGISLIVWLPLNSLIVPAVFLGIDLIFFGGSFIAFGLSIRSAQRKLKESGDQLKAA